MRILVTGSREWAGRGIMIRAILACEPDLTKIAILHGGARGADRMAGEIAYFYDLGVEEYPADWDKYGRQAGVIRNQEMVNTRPDVCLAFFCLGLPNKGTRDCADRARAAGIPVKVFWDDEEGGDSEPCRTGPDNPATGESRLPGATGKHQALQSHSDNPWRVGHVVPI